MTTRQSDWEKSLTYTRAGCPPEGAIIPRQSHTREVVIKQNRKGQTACILRPKQTTGTIILLHLPNSRACQVSIKEEAKPHATVISRWVFLLLTIQAATCIQTEAQFPKGNSWTMKTPGSIAHHHIHRTPILLIEWSNHIQWIKWIILWTWTSHSSKSSTRPTRWIEDPHPESTIILWMMTANKWWEIPLL